jgi:tRNA (mo5U34)-methyltransferase
MMKALLRRLDKGHEEQALPPKARSADELRAMIANLGTWMYRFDLGFGVETALHNEYLDTVHRTRWEMILPELKRIYGGRWNTVRALDSACNEGWFAFELTKLGAKDVVGFDAREANVGKAQLVQSQTGVHNVSFHVDDIFNVSPERYGMFDLVMCLGLMYHLEDPMGALRRLRTVTRGVCVIDTEVARAGSTVDIERGPNVGVVTTSELFAVVAEPEFTWNPLSSVTGISFVPNLSALKMMLCHAGFRDITVLSPKNDSESRYVRGDRVILIAQV